MRAVSIQYRLLTAAFLLPLAAGPLQVSEASDSDEPYQVRGYLLTTPTTRTKPLAFIYIRP